jgi:hypothetical protein
MLFPQQQRYPTHHLPLTYNCNEDGWYQRRRTKERKEEVVIIITTK